MNFCFERYKRLPKAGGRCEKDDENETNPYQEGRTSRNCNSQTERPQVRRQKYGWLHGLSACGAVFYLRCYFQNEVEISRRGSQMKNAVTIDEMGVLLVKAVKKLSSADRKRLGELLLASLRTPVGGLKRKS